MTKSKQPKRIVKAKLWSVDWQNPRYSGERGSMIVNARNAKEAIIKSKIELRWIQEVKWIATED